LLTLIERESFDVFLAGDKNMDKQQRPEGRPFAVAGRLAAYSEKFSRARRGATRYGQDD
jgi:hypothetical protein